jgi:hypothetical protein
VDGTNTYLWIVCLTSLVLKPIIFQPPNKLIGSTQKTRLEPM